MINNIDWTQRHWILEKLDGSMVSFYKRNDGIIQCHTKMGRTKVAEPIIEFVSKSNILYNAFFEACLMIGATPIYEWCSRQQKIVVDYPEESLILTAIRRNISGEYIPYDKMVRMASVYRIPCVKAYDMNIENPNDFLKIISELDDSEGVVVRFESGHMCKIKASWYMKLHNSIDIVKFEKNIIDIIVNDMLDDLVPILINGTKEPIEKFAEDFQNNILKSANRLQTMVDENKSVHDKKSFAIEVAPKLDKIDVRLIFRIWNGENPVDAVKNLLKQNCGSSTAIDSVRKYFGNICWMDYYNTQPNTED
jgi:T4 RnlA family RNA ligase